MDEVGCRAEELVRSTVEVCLGSAEWVRVVPVVRVSRLALGAWGCVALRALKGRQRGSSRQRSGDVFQEESLREDEEITMS